MEGTDETVKKYYAIGMTQIAVRTIEGDSDTLNWILTDHLSSASVIANADGTLLSEVKYTAFGEIRSGSGDLPTKYQYTGQLSQMAEVGLYHYGARFFDPALSHFVSADTIVPSAGNVLDFNRFAYVRYNPIRHTDPTGHMVADDLRGGCGLTACIYSFQQDLLASKIFKGSNDDGSWNWEDRYYYSSNRDRVWADPSSWLNPDPEGWEGFAARVDRFSSHYTEKEKNKFLRDFSLVWGGIPNDTHFVSAGLSVGQGPHDIQPLNESNTGLRSDLTDTLNGPNDNQSHHYAGLFFFGYFVSSDIARGISYLRDHDNPGDIALGEIAIRDGYYFRRYGFYSDLVTRIRDLIGQ